MRELQFKCKSVECFTGTISELKFIGVLIKFEDLENLSDNIEISTLFAGFVKISAFLSTEKLKCDPFLPGELLRRKNNVWKTSKPDIRNSKRFDKTAKLKIAVFLKNGTVQL